jgi:glyoxylase-like metal-dependent hydrolase (beta-lactamase superfamily II)
MAFPPIQDLGFGITCIDTGLNGRTGAGACYLIREGDAAAFVDTGTYHAVPGLLAVLAQLGVAHEQVRYVCPTHVHTDHGGGAGELRRQRP